MSTSSPPERSLYVVLRRKFYQVTASDLASVSELGDLEKLLRSRKRARRVFEFTRVGMVDLLEFLKEVSEAPEGYLVKKLSAGNADIIVIFITDEKLLEKAIIFCGVASALKARPSKPKLLGLIRAIEGIKSDEELERWSRSFLEAYKSSRRREEIRKVARAFASEYMEELLGEVGER